MRAERATSSIRQRGNVDRSKAYKVVVNSFATRNTANLNAYFGTTDLAFEAVPALKLKSTIAAALAA